MGQVRTGPRRRCYIDASPAARYECAFHLGGRTGFRHSKLASSECWLVQVRTEGGEIVKVCTSEERWDELTSGAEFTAADGDRKH